MLHGGEYGTIIITIRHSNSSLTSSWHSAGQKISVVVADFTDIMYFLLVGVFMEIFVKI